MCETQKQEFVARIQLFFDNDSGVYINTWRVAMQVLCVISSTMCSSDGHLNSKHLLFSPFSTKTNSLKINSLWFLWLFFFLVEADKYHLPTPWLIICLAREFNSFPQEIQVIVTNTEICAASAYTNTRVLDFYSSYLDETAFYE